MPINRAQKSVATTVASAAHVARSGREKLCRIAQLAHSKESPSSYGGDVGGSQQAHLRDDQVQALRRGGAVQGGCARKDNGAERDGNRGRWGLGCAINFNRYAHY